MVLVGRSLELAALARLVADSAGGRGRLALIGGEPGIGKSRLVEEAARASGLPLAWGRCWEEGGAPAFWPWIQVLRVLHREVPAIDVPPEIARLLPELSASAAAPVRPLAEERFLLFDAIHRYATAVANVRPVVIVIDDLHAADVASLQVLAFLASHLQGSPLAVLATYRTSEARTTPEVGALIARLGRDAETIVPRRLSRDDLAELAAEAGITDAGELAAIERASEGNPLFARELVKLRVRGDTAAVPDTVRDAIREHLRRLSPELRQVAEAAAVLGREVSRPQVASLVGRDDVGAELAALVDHGVLVAPGPGRLAFVHGLFVETLHHDLATPRAEQLHARAAELLAGTATDAELTRHLFAAGPAHTRAAIAAARRAADGANRQLATDEAAGLLARATAAVPPDDVELAYDLAIELGAAQITSGSVSDGKATCLRAAALARTLADARRLARAAATYGIAMTIGSTDRVLVGLIEEALGMLPAADSPDRARLLGRLAAALQPASDPHGPIAIGRDAIAMARRLGDRRVLLEVLFAAMAAFTHFGDPTERIALNTELLGLAAELGETSATLRTHYRLVVDHIESGDIAGAAAHADHYARLSRDMRQPHVRWPAAAMRALFALHAGRLDDHAAEVAESERLFRATGGLDPQPVAMLGLFRIVSMIALADEAALASSLKLFMETLPGAHRVYAIVGTAYGMVLAGEVTRARAQLAQIAPDEIIMFDDPIVFSWAGDVAVRLADRALAGSLLAALQGNERWCGSGWPSLTIEAPLSRVRGLLAALLGRHDEARTEFTATLAKLRAARLPVLLARTLVEWAACGAATPDESAAALAEARVLASELRLPIAARLAATPPAPAAEGLALIRDGETWLMTRGSASCRLKHNRGLELIARLVAEPARELHVLDLVGADVADTGDAGDVIDREAIAAYRARAAELREELDEAEAFNDPGRRERALAELEAIHDQLSGGTRLGNRPRRTAGATERARVNVQRRIADAIRKIAEQTPELARHLEAAIRTGGVCSYDPRRVP